MKLLKPAWVSHDGKPVFSVHIHPDGSRFATGGQGGDAGLVAVWNMEPVRSVKAELDQKIPKLLCSMTNHLSCVNCVRWSNQGKYLASGSDDNDVMIWRCSGSGKQGEHWSCAHILRHHSGDVLDLAWSPDDSYLATASVDNSIVIWDVDSFAVAPEVKTKLINHSGMVKGVSWDPMGKYLASQSDDKSLRVWRISDWKEESTIRDPFSKCGAVTHVLRLGWSPDGQYVVSTHALNNDGPVAKIVERGSWKACMDFVGHRKAVEVVSFNPKLLRHDGGTYTCCAVGSRDRSLSIWLTCFRRPLVVLHDLFSNSILDISWGISGLELLVCSHDGTVAYVSLSQKEIGKRLTEEDTNRTMKNLYGFVPGRLADQGANALIENPSILKLRQGGTPSKDAFSNQAKRTPVTPTSTATSKPPTSSSSFTNSPSVSFPTFTGSSNSSVPVHNFSSSSQPASTVSDAVKQQQETRTKEGRRRIMPILLACKTTASNVPAPFGSSTAPAAEVTPPKSSGSASNDTGTSPVMATTTDTWTPDSPAKPSDEEHAAKNSGTTTGTAAASPTTTASTTAALTTATTGTASTGDKPMTIQPLSPEKAPASSAVTVGVGRGAKRKQQDHTLPAKRIRRDTAAATKAGSTAASSTVDSSTSIRHTVATAGHGTHGTAASKSTASTATAATGTAPSLANTSVPVLPAVVIKTSQTCKVSCSKGSDLILEGKNTPGSQANTVSCFQDGQQLWNIAIYSRIVLLAASKHVVGVATEDKGLTLLSIHGRRLTPRLCLASSALRVSASEHYVAVVTTTGHASVWDCRALIQVVSSESVLHLLNDGDHVSGLDITSFGHPLVSISALRAYIFNPKMAAWLLLSDNEDPVNKLSSYAVRKSAGTLASSTAGGESSASGATASAGTGKSSGGVGSMADLRPLARIQGLVCAEGNREAAMRAGGMLRQDGTQTRLANQAFLEHQVASALALESHTEYQFWLMAYVRYLTQEGMDMTLKDLCSSLMRGLHNASAAYDELFLLGISKRRLVKDILVVMATNISLQRYVAQLQEQVESLPAHTAL